MSLFDTAGLGLGLGGLLAPSGSNLNNQAIQNVQNPQNPQNAQSAQPGSWVTVTTNNTSGAIQGGGLQGGIYQNPTSSLVQETHKMLEEVRDDLLPLKKWLIETYPDIYKQYVAVEEIRKASNE